MRIKVLRVMRQLSVYLNNDIWVPISPIEICSNKRNTNLLKPIFILLAKNKKNQI